LIIPAPGERSRAQEGTKPQRAMWSALPFSSAITIGEDCIGAML